MLTVIENQSVQRHDIRRLDLASRAFGHHRPKLSAKGEDELPGSGNIRPYGDCHQCDERLVRGSGLQVQ